MTKESGNSIEVNNKSFSIKDSLKRATASLLVAGALSGPMVGEVRAESNPNTGSGTTVTETGVMPSQETAPTLAYAKRMKKIEAYKKELNSNECKPENLDFCARVLYAVDQNDGFYGSEAYPVTYPEKSVLRNYLSRDEVIKFGRTGKGLDIVYFKDDKGKKTNVPALLYVGAADWNVGLKQVQKAIDNWEKDAPGFLKAMYANDVCVFFQSKVGDYAGSNAKYKNGIILFNCGLIDKKDRGSSNYVKTISLHLGVEQFGIKLDELGEKYLGGAGAVIKQALAVDCNEYLAAKTGDKFFSDRVKGYGRGFDNYMGMSGCDPKEIDELITELKANNWITPYGAETWAEIDGK